MKKYRIVTNGYIVLLTKFCYACSILNIEINHTNQGFNNWVQARTFVNTRGDMMDAFMNWIGCRNMMIERKIEEFLAAVKRGESEISIECENMTDDEIKYLQREVQRRLKRLKL